MNYAAYISAHEPNKTVLTLTLHSEKRYVIVQTLWPWQQQAADEALKYPKRALFWSPRLGKTQAAIATIQAWGVTKGIIVCPLLVAPMWVRLLEEAGLTVQAAYKGTLQARRATIAQAHDEVIVINYDAVPGLIKDLLKYRGDFLVVDESHWIKSPSAKRARAVRRIAWQTKYIRLLTGTPAPNHYGELWGQLTCVDQEQWGKFYTRFANRHLIRDHVYHSKVLDYIDLPRINRLINEGASIVRREDVFGPDQYQRITRYVELPELALKSYKKLAKEWVLNDPPVTAEHVLKRLVRLQQFTSGYLPSDATASNVEVHNAKVSAVVADLDEIVASGEKAIIFHRFRWEGVRYAETLKRAFPEAYHGSINGSVKTEERARIAENFNAYEGPAILVIQSEAGGIGIGLQEADHVLLVSRSFSFDKDKQAIDRAYKQTTELGVVGRCVTSYVVRGTVDMHIERKLNNKESIHEAVTHADRQSIAFGEEAA